jgi:hypothetical protein
MENEVLNPGWASASGLKGLALSLDTSFWMTMINNNGTSTLYRITVVVRLSFNAIIKAK